jgi:hypothetical protein
MSESLVVSCAVCVVGVRDVGGAVDNIGAVAVRGVNKKRSSTTRNWRYAANT